VPHTDDDTEPVSWPCAVVKMHRVAEAFDLLGGMWSWYDPSILEPGKPGGLPVNTWWVRAGHILREVVGRPAKPPEPMP
jgi:hypothetical protein